MIRGQQDFWSGLLFVGFGAVALVIGRDYAMGTAMRMGPGYFPMILAGLLDHQAARVIDAYRRQGLMPTGRIDRGEWPTLVLRKRRRAR